jgi:L-iditol 2-dehydrogenase
MKVKKTPGSGKIGARSRTMLAARLHGPKDLRVEQVASPGQPRPGEALLRLMATGICGSDLHSYQDARIGDTSIRSPLILGHEFSAVVEQVGSEGLDGCFHSLQPGVLVAVDPAQPCHQCEMCEQGHPNLCCNLHFCSNYPYSGSLCEWMVMPSRCCFPVPREIDHVQAALLEPLGVAIHAVDLAKVRVTESLAVLGAGPIGLLIVQMAILSGASPVFAIDRFPWRLNAAANLGAVPISDPGDPAVREITAATLGRGVDVAIEAAWGNESVGQAAEMVRLGGRLVLVGIPSDDHLGMKHSTARRKGLTIRMCRRMKHCYPRAIQLAAQAQVDLHSLVTHRFPLRQASEAFALNAAYRDQVIKAIVESAP